MKILVTGSNGFIGQSICGTLKSHGHAVIGTGIENYSICNIDDYVSCDISKEDTVEKLLPFLSVGDIIVHTAASLSKDDFDRKLININCAGALNVLELSVKAHCNKIINISGAPIIGIPRIHPIDEDHPVEPCSLYHATKVMQEHIFGLAEKYGIKTVNIRVPAPIGAGMNKSTILAVFINHCLNNETIEVMGNGTREQNYIDIRDIAKFVEQCCCSDCANGTFIIGSEKPISNLELAKKCVAISNSSSEIILGNNSDPQEGIIWDYSCDKAKGIGFVCRYDIDTTIHDIIKAWEIKN